MSAEASSSRTKKSKKGKSVAEDVPELNGDVEVNKNKRHRKDKRELPVPSSVQAEQNSMGHRRYRPVS